MCMAQPPALSSIWFASASVCSTSSALHRSFAIALWSRPHMTPRMVQELSRQEMERTRQREFLFSNGVSNLIVFSAHPPKRPFDSDHFMLHPWPNRGKAQDEPITGEYIMAVMAAAMPQTKSN